MKKKTVSFLVSGRGSNFTAVAEKILQGSIDAQVGVCISDRGDAKALDTASEMGISAEAVLPKDYGTREEHDRAMVKLLKKYKTDLVVTAGYMRILTPYFIREYRNRIINIHPSLLPAFPGVHSQKQAFDYGVKITGCTTHFIDEGTDTGPIILQAEVPVLSSDTVTSLSQKILQREHEILPQAVSLFCQNRLVVSGRNVLIVS